jgi:hypothetical protein
MDTLAGPLTIDGMVKSFLPRWVAMELENMDRELKFVSSTKTSLWECSVEEYFLKSLVSSFLPPYNISTGNQ